MISQLRSIIVGVLIVSTFGLGVTSVSVLHTNGLVRSQNKQAGAESKAAVDQQNTGSFTSAINQLINFEQRNAATDNTQIAVSGRVVVTGVTTLNVRAVPNGKIIGKQSQGTTGVITDGPQVAQKTTWFQVSFDNGLLGWVSGDYLAVDSQAVQKEVAIPNIVKTVQNLITPVKNSAVTKSSGNTVASVSSHASQTDCWLIISGSIYDVTSFLTNHPGGVSAIEQYCGKDATLAFQTHGRSGGTNHSSYAYSLLPSYFVGSLATAPGTYRLAVTKTGTGTGSVTGNSISCGAACSIDVTAGTSIVLSTSAAADATFSGWSGSCSGTGTCSVSMNANQNVTANFDLKVVPVVKNTSTDHTMTGVATHSIQGNCWIVISNSIYDVTSFLSAHPGGVAAITPYCGKDATTAFQTHGRSGGNDHSAYAYSLLPTYYIAALSGAQPIVPASTYSLSVSAPNGTVTSSPAGISCGSTCTATFPAGTVVTLSVSPSSGYSFSGWTGACTGAGACTVSLSANKSVTALYASTAPANSGSTYSTSQVAPHNTQGNCWIIISGKVYDVTSWISAHPGGANAIVSRCGTDSTAVFTTNVAGGHVHSAYASSLLPSYYAGDVTTVAPPPAGSTTYTLSVSKAGTGSGTISGGSISCGSTCSTSIVAGSSVTLSATPNSTSVFSGWGGACSGTGSCVVSVSANTFVTATFASNGAPATTYTAAQVATHAVRADCWIIISNKVYDVTPWINSHPGGVSAIVSRCGTDSTTAFTTSGAGGHRHSASATAMLPSYYVGDLSGSSGGTTPPSSTSFTLSVSKSGTGSGAVTGSTISCGTTCSANVVSGTSVTLSATPATGSTFTGWSGSCSGTANCTVTLTANTTVTASFDATAGGGGTGGTTPQTYTINVNSAGVYDTTNITLNVGDKITFVYTAPRTSEVKTTFSPTGISTITLDKDITQRTKTFTAAGTWTFSAVDHNGNQGTIVVQ